MKFIQILGLALALEASWPITADAQTPIYSFTTIGGQGSGNADGTNTDARFDYPSGVALDSTGNLYVADTRNHTIRQLKRAGSNWVSRTIAGLAPNPGTADGINSDARFNRPSSVAVDTAGNVYVADTGNQTIRQLTSVGTNWVVTTIAGLAGSGGSADGTNNDTLFSRPSGIAVDTADNLFVADTDNSTIRRLTRTGTNWVCSTIAGKAGNGGSQNGTGIFIRFRYPEGVAVDKNGNVFVADTLNDTVRWLLPVGTNYESHTIGGIPGNPGPSNDGPTGVSRYFGPSGIGVNGVGNVYVADTVHHTIRRLDYVNGYTWQTSTLVGMAGSFGSADGTNSVARFTNPIGVVLDGDTVYVADTWNHTIRQVTPAGTNWVVHTLAGVAGGPGSSDGCNGAMHFYGPSGVALSSAGILYVADSLNCTIRQLTPTGANWVSTTIAGLAGSPGGADGTNSDARFIYPKAVAADSADTLYVADTFNNQVRQLRPEGTNWVCSTIVTGFEGPRAIAADSLGRLFVTDFNSPRIYQVSKMGATWTSRAIAEAYGPTLGVAADRRGNVYVTDTYNSTILQLTPAGTNWITRTIAGLAKTPGSVDGTNSDARFFMPAGIATDIAGNLFVTDNQAIRQLTPLGTNWVVTTVGGLAGVQGGADGTNSRFGGPYGITVDTAGNLYVADYPNSTIRKGVPPSGPAKPPILQVPNSPVKSITITWLAVVGRTYQLRSKPDLCSTNWTDLRGPLFATNAIMSACEIPATDIQRFYRVVLLPKQ
jgi:sugar lactone lactonase YvrE